MPVAPVLTIHPDHVARTGRTVFGFRRVRSVVHTILIPPVRRTAMEFMTQLIDVLDKLLTVMDKMQGGGGGGLGGGGLGGGSLGGGGGGGGTGSGSLGGSL